MIRSKSALSSQAGLLAVQSFSEDSGLNKIIDKLSTGDGERVRLGFATSVKMVVTGLIGGAGSLLGVIAIWNDKILANMTGLKKLPDDSTLGRSFKRQNKQSIADFEALPSLLELGIKDKFITLPLMKLNSRTEEIIDIDGSPIVSYGHQEGAIKGYNHTKKGANCYQSLLAFDSMSKTVKLAWLQSGNTHCANGIIDFSRQLHSLNPSTKKFYRLDSGFFSGAAMDEFDSQKNGYLVKAKLTAPLKKILADLSWEKIPKKPGKQGWEQADFYHACKDWSKRRLFSAVRIKIDEYTDDESLFPDQIIEKYAYFCYVCTRKMDPWPLHKFYGQRATCENWIDELKNQIFLGKMRTRDFDSTSLMFHCSVLAYNLLRWMAICSSNKRLISWEIASIRCFIIRIAAKICNARQLLIEIHGHHLYQAELDAWMNFCRF